MDRGNLSQRLMSWPQRWGVEPADHFRQANRMGIKFYCPNGHKMHVKGFLAGKKGLCPKCGVRVEIPIASVSQPPSPIAVAGESTSGKSTSPAKSKKDLPSKPASVFGMPADGLADDSMLPETIGDEAVPASDIASPATSPDDDSSAGVIELEIEMPVPAADPLQIPPGENWFVHLPSGKQLGPVGSDTLREWLDQGRVGVDALVWRNDWSDWRVIRDAFSQNQFAAAASAGANPARMPLADSQPVVASGMPDQLLGYQLGYQRFRRKSRFTATASLCLIGLVVLLFVLLLIVFFRRGQGAKVSRLENRQVLAPIGLQSRADFS